MAEREGFESHFLVYLYMCVYVCMSVIAKGRRLSNLGLVAITCVPQKGSFFVLWHIRGTRFGTVKITPRKKTRRTSPGPNACSYKYKYWKGGKYRRSPHERPYICFTRSLTSAFLPSLNLSMVPTRYPVILRTRSNFTPSPTLPFFTITFSILLFLTVEPIRLSDVVFL